MRKMIFDIISELKSSKYLKNILVLSSGVGISQLIPLIALPFLTRFFSPYDFGILAIFLALTQLIAISSTLRLEMAVVLPKKNTDAAILCLNAFVLLVITSVLVFFILYFLWKFLENNNSFYFDKLYDIKIWMSQLSNKNYFPFLIILVPFGSFFLGLYNILYAWNNRIEMYKNMSFSHLSHSIFSTPLSIFFYFTKLKIFALILGQIIGRFVACISLATSIIDEIKKIDFKNIFINSRFLVHFYKKFIIYETPQSILNFFSQKIILAFFTFSFGFFVVGVFDLADKIIGKPLGIISNSLKTVYYKRITTAQNKPLIFVKSVVLMSLVCSVVIIPFFLLNNEFYIFLFGPNWGDTALFVKMLCPLLFFRFVSNVVTPSISYKMENQILLIWQIIYLVALLVLFLFFNFKSVNQMILTYSITGACMYLILGILSYLTLKKYIS